MIISISDLIIILICITLSIIFFIFINRDKFSFNCKKNTQSIQSIQSTQSSIKFDDEANFDDNIKLISWTLSSTQLNSNSNNDTKIIDYVNKNNKNYKNRSINDEDLELL